MLLKLIPQPLARAWCALRRHPQKVYRAKVDGVLCSVSTCRCGGRQEARLTGANREISRAARRAARRRG